MQAAGLIRTLQTKDRPTRLARAPVVQNEQIDPGELADEPGVAAVAAGQRQRAEQPGRALIKDREVVPARAVAQRAGDEALAGAAGAGDQAVPMLAHPVATRQPQEQGSVETALCAQINILDRGGLAQLGGAGARREPLLLAQRGFLLDQQAKPFSVIERPTFGVRRQVAKSLRHPLQAKLVQAIQCRVVEQCRSPQWK